MIKEENCEAETERKETSDRRNANRQKKGYLGEREIRKDTKKKEKHRHGRKAK